MQNNRTAGTRVVREAIELEWGPLDLFSSEVLTAGGVEKIPRILIEERGDDN